LLEYKAFSSDAFTGLLKCRQAMALYLARLSVFKKQQEPRKRGSNTPSKGGGGHLKTLAYCKKYRLEKKHKNQLTEIELRLKLQRQIQRLCQALADSKTVIRRL
jgi:hypothetical protein